MRVETNSSSGPLAAGYYQVAILVSSGTSRTLVDFMLHVVPITDLPRPAAMDGAMLTGDAEVGLETYTAALVELFQSIDTDRPHSGGVPATFAGGWPDELPAKA